MKTPLTFGKLVSSPTPSSWSQSYNAGNLVAALGLTSHAVDETQKDALELSLASIGKELLGDLEAEYFTLETKSLQSIKQAILTVVEKIPETVTASFCVAVLMEQVLYVFVYGKGKIAIFREGKLGTLLTQDVDAKVTSASGFIQNGDIVILQTHAFTTHFTHQALLAALENNSLEDMVEALSPSLEKIEDGGATAISFLYHDTTQPDSSVIEKSETVKQSHEKYIDEETTHEIIEEPEDNVIPSEVEGSSSAEPANKMNETSTHHQHLDTPIEEAPLETIESTPSHNLSSDNFTPVESLPIPTPSDRPFPKPKLFHLSHSRRLLLSIALILVIVLVGSIIFSVKKQQDAKTQALYASLIIPAQKKYDEGQSLASLNPVLATSDYQQAQSMAQDAKAKLPANSTYAKQADDLLSKINTALSQAASQTSNTTQIDLSTNPYLQIISKHTEATAFDQDDKNVYLATPKGVLKVTKTGSKETTSITNDNTWKNATGLGAYLGNFYLLDTASGIDKFVPSGSSFTKSSYFTGTTPDLSAAKSIAIDGSIWIVSSDGSIVSYTRGKQDSFTAKLDKPLKNPTQIYTNTNTNNLYILDNGNNRVIVLSKTGSLVNQYSASVIAQARAFDVQETNKKIYILSGSSAYSIDLK